MASVSPGFGFQSGYAIIFILLLITSILSFLTYRSKHQAKQITSFPEAKTEEQKIERLFSNSKLGGFPLSLILINTLQVYRDDLPILNAQLEKLLREQDLMVNGSNEEIILLLPYTKEEGTLKLITQIKELMIPLLRGNVSKIGYAKMQQHDSITSLIKRANVQQLRQRKQRETN